MASHWIKGSERAKDSSRKYSQKSVLVNSYLEVRSGEGREESGELVAGVLGLVESVFDGGVSTFLNK